MNVAFETITSDSDFVWISPKSRLPSVGCVCGMFADDVTTVRQERRVQMHSEFKRRFELENFLEPS